MKKTTISIFALLVLGVFCLFLFSRQSYKKTVVQYYANDQNLPNRITYSEYSEYSDKREANYGGTLNITSIKQANDGVYATYEGQLTPLQY